jgi:hypothetical protein
MIFIDLSFFMLHAFVLRNHRQRYKNEMVFVATLHYKIAESIMQGRHLMSEVVPENATRGILFFKYCTLS